MNEIGTDPAAFEALYREHLPFVRSFVARRVHDPHTAADLTADIVVAVESAHRYRPAASPPPWPGSPASPATSSPDLSSPTCLVTPDGAEDRLRVGGNLGLEGELLAVDLDRR